jgi:hypothetical protein
MLNVILWTSCIVVAKAAIETNPMAALFDAIRAVESGGAVNSRDAVGDGGRSIGPYQISLAYWQDSGVRGSWGQCRDDRYSKVVMLAYWSRYCPEALRRRDFETLARIHNGGPTGHLKQSTLRYWGLVQARLAPAPVAHSHRSTE